MRTVTEWIGKNDDAMPPPSVRLRIFETHNGICFFANRKIRPGEKWHLHHVKELWDGGENRESNIAPALDKYHRAHSAKQQTVKAVSDTKRKKHLGIKKEKSGFWKPPGATYNWKTGRYEVERGKE